jgi:hypothetical protein
VFRDARDVRVRNSAYRVYTVNTFMGKIIEGSLEVKLPTIWTDGQAEMGSAREEKRRRKKIKKEKVSEEIRSRCAKR